MSRSVRKPVAGRGTLTAKEAKAVDALFDVYAGLGDEPECIGPAGCEALCAAMELDPSDCRVLIFAWLLGAQRMGYFERAEWRVGLARLGTAEPAGMAKTLGQFHKDLGHSDMFKDFFRYAFGYCLTEPRQKSIDLETASAMLRIVAGDSQHTEDICEFLTSGQEEAKVINLDQWMSILEFNMKIDANYANYDDTKAWPLLLDYFVDWAREKKGIPAPSSGSG